MAICDRCPSPPGVHRVSWFNLDVICPACQKRCDDCGAVFCTGHAPHDGRCDQCAIEDELCLRE